MRAGHSLRARATIIVLRVPKRLSAVRARYHCAHAATAHEFERQLYVRKADRHRATSEYLIKDLDRAPGIRGQPGSAHGKTCPCDRQNLVLATAPVS